MDDDYTTNVTHLRVHDEGDGWALDGAGAGGEYTERVWKYDSVEDAVKDAPEFVRQLKAEGITVPETDGTVSLIVHRLEELRVSVR